MNSKSEADILFEFTRHLQNTLDKKTEYHGIKLNRIKREVNVNGGYADVVLENQSGNAFLVIEGKREMEGSYKKSIDPFAQEVISQAHGYASKLASKFFATYNKRQLVVFVTDDEGTRLLNRQVKSYQIKDIEKFAPVFLDQIAGLAQEKVKWDTDPDVFVRRLEVFHERLSQQLSITFREKIEEESFKEDFENWINEQGWDIDRSEEISRFVNQASYLLMNKLLFYKILSDREQYDVPTIGPYDLKEADDRRRTFNRVTEEIDFEAIYRQDPIFDRLSLTEEARIEVTEFLDELEHYDLQQFNQDTVGYIYEQIIPSEERHSLGQYYTPADITDLITKLTVENPDDKVLDPACGSGTFLISAYSQLEELKGEGKNHWEIIEQLYGVDINKFPAHLSAINLAIQDLGSKTEKVNINVENFFELKPGEGRHDIEEVDHRGTKGQSSSQPKVPNKVDAVVANPPYIRQEKINSKELCREHLSENSKDVINSRSDIYVYFFTHAKDFLNEQGRIGFITSDKWLTVGYGEGLQDFFLEHFKIEAIISFNKRQFEDPLVPTCVTILEECDNSNERDQNISKFIRIKERMNVEDIIELVAKEEEPNKFITNEKHRLVTKPQGDLKEANKWNRYLFAPNIYWKLQKSAKISPLEDTDISIRRGITTGANDFFYLDEKEIENWGIDKKFLKPIAKSIRQAEVLEFTEADTNLYVLDLNDYVTKRLNQATNTEIGTAELNRDTLPSNATESDLSNQETYILTSLLQEGYNGLFNYIIHSMWKKDWGRSNPPQKRATCKQHKKQNGCWFNLGPHNPPDLISAKGYWERIFIPLSDNVLADNQLYELRYKDRELLGGILNTNLSRLFRELHGRVSGGGLTRMMVYETKRWPILKPSSLIDSEKNEIREEFRRLKRTKDISSRELNMAVLKPLGLEDKCDEITAYANALSKSRREGKEVEELVAKEQVEKVEELTLEGAEEISGKETTKEFDF